MLTASTGEKPGAIRDKAAGRRLRDLREARGLSPEQMPHEMLRAKLTPVSGPTIRRVESVGMIPQVRHRFALAAFFGLEVRDLWRAPRRHAKTGERPSA